MLRVPGFFRACLSLAPAVLCLLCVAKANASDTPLREGWTLQSACKIQADGATISTAAFPPQGSITVAVPATVLAAQVAAGEFKQPYFGMNLRNIPGTSYPIGKNFSNLPMPDDSPYRCGWWYRNTV